METTNLWGRPSQVEAKDPDNNVYKSDEWVLYASGWGVHGIGLCVPFINATTKTWFLRVWAVHNATDNYIDVLAIPIGYFQKFYQDTFV